MTTAAAATKAGATRRARRAPADPSSAAHHLLQRVGQDEDVGVGRVKLERGSVITDLHLGDGIHPAAR